MDSHQGSVTAVVVAVIGAVALIVSALITHSGQNNGGENNSPATASSSPGPTQAPRPINSPTRAQTSGPPPGSSVLKKGTALIVEADNNGYDLDTLAPAADQNSADIQLQWNFVNETLNPVSAQWMANADGEPATYAGCSQAQEREDSTVVVDSGGEVLQIGSKLCLLTSNGHLASLTLKSLIGSSTGLAGLNFSAIVWRGGGLS
jgi:hypothetical protein